jgi:hypothetical protein
MHMVKGHERKIIAYPIREGAIMNLVALIREFVPKYCVGLFLTLLVDSLL